MRVTQNQITRQYLKNSSSALENMSKINNRVLTQRKFLRASEDPIGASKAIVIRRNLAKTDMYINNLDNINDIYNAAESAMMTVSDISKNVNDSILYGVNGTQGNDERKIIAEQIRNTANEMLRQVNTEFADRRVFGGTNNETLPFQYNTATGVMTFNGHDIDENNITLFPETADISVDVGLGIKFDASGNVDKQTVMNLAINGAEVFGHGVDADGDSKNLIKLAFQAANAIDSNDIATATRLIGKVNEARTTLMVGITKLGNFEQSVEYNKARAQDQSFNLKVSQKTVEGVDLTEEITNYKVAEMAYNATLSMGSKVIPSSIFDFI